MLRETEAIETKPAETAITGEEKPDNFKSIFDNAFDGILIVDSTTGKILMGNRMICEMLGFDEEELIKINARDIHPEKDLAYIMEQLEKHERREIDVAKDIPIKRKDGSIFYVDIRPGTVIIGGKTYLSWILRDRKTEETLRESELSFKTLAENIPGIAYRVFKRENDRIKIFSNNSKDITGYSEHELESREEHSIYDLILSKDMPKVIEEVEKAIQEKRNFSIDYRLLHKDGSIKYLVEQGKPIFGGDGRLLYIDGVIFDSTQRKLKEEEYEHLARIVETATDFIGISDYDGHLHYINPAGRKMLGISLNEDISDLYVPSLFPENAQDVFMNEAIPAAIRSGVWIGEMNMVSREGKEIPVSQALVAHRTIEDKIAFFFTIARDITERKRIELELILAKDEALLANRAKSEFLAKMSHELRTPLNSVMGFSEILRMKTIGELNEKQEQYVNFIYQSGMNLLAIINDILDLVKLESGKKLPLIIQSFPAPEAIEEALLYVNEKAESRKIVIHKGIDPGLGMIKADKLRFKQILINLIDNAIKFSKPNGGTITIIAQNDGDMAKFLVSDTGIGIREEDLRKLFDLFHQLDSGLNRSFGGAGVGLALTKRLVEQQEGKMWVESKFEEGSTFGFTLPLEVNKSG